MQTYRRTENRLRQLGKGLSTIYPRIRMLRKGKRITQAEMGAELGVSQRVYAYYENGQRVIPPQALITLADFHGVSVDYLLGLTDQTAPYPRSKEEEQLLTPSGAEQ